MNQMTKERIEEYRDRLAKMVDQTAPKVAAMTDVREVRAFLRAEIVKVIDEFPEMGRLPRLVPPAKTKRAPEGRRRNGE
jgi:hypothetical protein